MSPKRLRLADDAEAAVSALADTLLRGGVAIFPTETVYGIGVAAGQPDALERLRRLKGRAVSQPFQCLIGDVADALRLGAVFSPGAERLARRYWPGPLTLVLPVGGNGETLGLRVPDSPAILAVIRRLGTGIVTSSANPAGRPPPGDAEAADVFPEGVDILIDGGVSPVGTASSVVRCGGEGYEILREGAIGAEAIAITWERE